MNLLETHIKNRTLAHAYFLCAEDAEPYIRELFPSPPHEIISYREKIGMDEIRALIQKASLASPPHARQIFLLPVRNFIGWAAQSALLKIIEEPPSSTHFILFSGSKEKISFPLQSRLIDGGSIHQKFSHPFQKEALAFIEAKENPSKRNKILEEIPDNEALGLFLDDLEMVLREKSDDSQGSIPFERIQRAQTMLRHPIFMPSLIKDYLTLFL